MPIVRPKPKSVESFISGAPDAVAEGTNEKKPRYVRKGRKIQITLTIAQPMLERVDALAARLGLSRAAVINLAINQGMEHGISVDAFHPETNRQNTQ
ncbi:MAG: CopG family transcriptional regulator [Acidobacteria bacterium]|nr:CopG family transcriptional regulator [Acidobacteriota bacterium]